MNTTPGSEDNPETPSRAGGEHVERLEALAALDPADAPDDAEALAADLARKLEGVASDGASRAQAEAAGDDEDSP